MKIIPNEAGEYFSIVIPSWNNLGFLKVCVDSILKNSTFKHQIIIHVNGGGIDGTLDWVKEQGFDYTFSEDNIGVCWAMNLMRTKVKTDYILFVNDDMYVLPEWDKFLKDEIERCDDYKFYISSTAIQPYKKDGYDTELTARGGELSNGQRQLIAFARTMISNPKILILDEATSSIDTKTEKLVQAGIAELLKGRTSFVIAHRLSTIANSDRIFVVNKKGIVESGTPDELYKSRGEYYKLLEASKSEVQ